MGENVMGWWVVAGLAIVASAALGWGYRAWRRAAALREAARLRASVEAAARIAAQQRAAEAAASRRAERETEAREAAARAVIARANAARNAAREAADHATAAREAAARQLAVARTRALAEQEAAARVARVAREHADRQMAEEAQRLEAHRQAAAQRLADPPPPAPPLAKPPADTLVLIADDSKVVRVKTGRLLAQHQYRVAYASDGQDAAEQLRTDPPDVVITDVEMPGMDGFELTRHVRQNPLTAHIPIIMITAADDQHRDNAQRAGVTVLLGKPYPEDELIGHIRRAMAASARAATRLGAG